MNRAALARRNGDKQADARDRLHKNLTQLSPESAIAAAGRPRFIEQPQLAFLAPSGSSPQQWTSGRLQVTDLFFQLPAVGCCVLAFEVFIGAASLALRDYEPASAGTDVQT